MDAQKFIRTNHIVGYVRKKGDNLYFNAGYPNPVDLDEKRGGYLYKIDIKSSRILWKSNHFLSNAEIYFKDNAIITAFNAEKIKSSLVCLKNSDGTGFWKVPLTERTAGFVLDNMAIYLSTSDGNIAEFVFAK